MKIPPEAGVRSLEKSCQPALGGMVDLHSYPKQMTEMKIKILWALVIILLSLLGSCTKKSTRPVQPTVYLMKDYFPLNPGDQWIWEILTDSIPEPFVDGDINFGEPFEDRNGNGVYDPQIDYFDSTMDMNGNGKWDGPNNPWTPGILYDDRNNNGEYDPPNGKWDEGEYFTDLDSNGVWN